MSELKSPDEVAAILRCSRKTLAGHVRAGDLRYVIVGLGKKRPRRMFTVEDIQEFIERQTRRDTPCRSIGPRARHTTNSTFKSDVVPFTALQAQRNAMKQKK